MRRCAALEPCSLPSLLRRFRLVAALALLTALAACGGSHSTYHARSQYNPSRYYPPPGPREDPWGPYIHEASGRFGVPETWVRRVMRQESGGQEDVISWAGAMGLMQVMPETYDGLRARYSLGDDPFDPHNNILAGTAYLREMYDRYGSPGFLAAYNAGPNRLDRYLNGGTPLPTETVNYVASIAPLLGPGTPMSGPLAVYAGPMTQLASSRTPAGCDPDAAYNPNGPCTKLRPAVVEAVAVAAVTPPYASAGCDPDAAYDPTRPCVPARPGPVQAVTMPPAVAVASRAPTPSDCDPDAAYDPSRPCVPVQAPTQQYQPPSYQPPVAAQARAPVVAQGLPLPPARRPNEYAMASRPIQERAVQPAAFVPWDPPGRWAIQVGAFANLSMAQSAAEHARSAVPDLLRTAKIELPATTPFGSQVAFRARLFGLSQSTASDACARLTSRGMACMTVAPPHESY